MFSAQHKKLMRALFRFLSKKNYFMQSFSNYFFPNSLQLKSPITFRTVQPCLVKEFFTSQLTFTVQSHEVHQNWKILQSCTYTKKRWNILSYPDYITTSKILFSIGQLFTKFYHIVYAIYPDLMLITSWRKLFLQGQMLFHFVSNNDLFSLAISHRSANEKIGDIFKTLGHCLKVILSFPLVRKFNSIFHILYGDDIFLVLKGNNICFGLKN